MKKTTSLAVASALSLTLLAGTVPTLSAEEEETAVTDGTYEGAEEEEEDVAEKSINIISHIVIDGLTDIKEENLKKMIVYTKEGDRYDKANIKKDLETITKSGVVQSIRARTLLSNGELYVVFEAKEMVDVTEVVITGNSLIPSEEIKPLLSTQPKREFVKENVDKDVSTIKDLYAKKGYIAIVSDVNNTNGKVTFSVVEAKVEGIRYSGNKRTRQWLLDKIVGFSVKEGDYLTTKALQQLYADLMATTLFEAVNVDASVGSSPNLVILDIQLQEARTGQWNIGGGYSSQYKLEAVGGVSDRNVNGEGKILNFDFGVGKDKQSFTFNYIDPYFNKSDTAFHVNLHRHNKTVNQSHDILEYDETRTGGSIGIVKPITKGKTTKLFADLDISYIQATSTKDDRFESDLHSNTLTVGVVNDSRDNALDPTQGGVIKGGITSSMKFLGSDYNFTKFFADARYYTKIAANDVLAARLNVNYSPNDIPYLEQFTIGGLDSVRGLDEDEQRGNKSLLASLELRHKFNDTIQGVIFVDAGKAWNDVVDNAMKVATGVGVRVKTGMGMLRLDVAKSPGESVKYLFGIGHSF